MKSRRVRIAIAITVTTCLGVSAALVTQAKASAGQASERSDSSRQALNLDIKTALGEGYTREDLRPIIDRLAVIDAAGPPLWLGDQTAFYAAQMKEVDQLRRDLPVRETDVLAQLAASTSAVMAQVGAGLDDDAALGADTEVLAPLRTALAATTETTKAGNTISVLRAAVTRAQDLKDKVSAIRDAQVAENGIVDNAAAALSAQYGGNLATIRQVGHDALVKGRNNATIATFLKIGAVAGGNRAMERYGAMLDSSNATSVSVGAAGSIRYAQEINAALLTGMPARTIVVSISAQEAWGYQQGTVVWNSLVTTGRPDLSTDIGAMQVLRKSSPWIMHSPWPKGSPYWYPDSPVRKVVWFTNSGEGLHDASWRSRYGPGTNLNGSHGCINVPSRNIDFLFSWAQIGDPVIVIPGDGTSAASQVAQDTVSGSSGSTQPKGA